jgi:hypothetical protein
MNLITNVMNLFGRRCHRLLPHFTFGRELPYRSKDWKLDPSIIFHYEVIFKGYVNTLNIFIISHIHREIARATDNQRGTSYV